MNHGAIAKRVADGMHAHAERAPGGQCMGSLIAVRLTAVVVGKAFQPRTH